LTKIEQLRALIDQNRASAEALYNKAKSENRDLTGEELASIEKCYDDADAAQKELKQRESVESRRDALIAKVDAGKYQLPRSTDVGKSDKPDEFKAVAGYLRARGDFGRMQPEDAKTLTRLSGELGGFWVGEEVSGEVISALRNELHILKLARVLITNSASFSIPVANLAMTFTWRGDNVSVAATNPTGVAGKLTLAPKTCIGKLLVPNELLDDVADLKGWLIDELKFQLAAEWETKFINGTGAGEPLGLLNGGLTNVDIDTATSTTIVPNDIRKLPGNMPAGYRQNAAWLIPRASLNKIALLRSNDGGANTGRYMWEPNFQTAGLPNKLEGAPVYETETWGLIETGDGGADGDAMLIYGNFKRGYCVVIRQGIEVKLMEDTTTAASNQSCLIAISRVDGAVMDCKSLLRLNRT